MLSPEAAPLALALGEQHSSHRCVINRGYAELCCCGAVRAREIPTRHGGAHLIYR